MFAMHIPILIAKDIDNREINILTEALVGISEILMGGRETVSRKEEITLLSRVLYYMSSFSSSFSTLGQDFSGIHVDRRNRQAGEFNLQRRGIVSMVLSLAPYISSKAEILSSMTEETMRVLLHNDQGISSID